MRKTNPVGSTSPPPNTSDAPAVSSTRLAIAILALRNVGTDADVDVAPAGSRFVVRRAPLGPRGDAFLVNLMGSRAPAPGGRTRCPSLHVSAGLYAPSADAFEPTIDSATRSICS